MKGEKEEEEKEEGSTSHCILKDAYMSLRIRVIGQSFLNVRLLLTRYQPGIEEGEDSADEEQ